MIALNQKRRFKKSGQSFFFKKRELSVSSLTVNGMSNRKIAETLSLFQWTVGSYIRSIYRKLSINSRTQAARMARTHELIG